MIRVKFGPNPQKIKEVEVTPSQKDSLIPFMKTLMKEDPANSKRSKKKGKSKDPVPAPPTPPKKTKKVRRKKNKSHRPLLLLQVWTERPQPDQVWIKVLLFDPKLRASLGEVPSPKSTVSLYLLSIKIDKNFQKQNKNLLLYFSFP